MNGNRFKDILIIGFAIFATFFGAGNIIFPTSLGFSVGDGWNIAIIGFLLSGIILPILAIVAVGKNGGSFENVTDKVGKVFSKFMLLSIMIFILGLVGLPRIGAVTYELGVNALVPGTSRILVSFIFYAITIYFAINPASVVDKIGKYLTPVLIGILFVIIGKGIISPIDTPTVLNVSNPFTTGFFTGYEVGDAFGGVVIASLFTAAVVAKGYTDPKKQTSMIIQSSIVGGVLLFIVYGGLLYIGATSSAVFPADMERTALLAGIVDMLFGKTGLTALSVAVIFACLTTAIGISSAISQYFSSISNGKLSYRVSVVGVNVVAGVYSILGVEMIMTVAIPILLVLYPALIILIILGLFTDYIPNRGAYIGATYFALFISFLSTLSMYGYNVEIISKLPFASVGFAWIIPSLIGMVLGTVLYKNKSSKGENLSKDVKQEA